MQRLASTLAADVIFALQYVEFLSSALSLEAYSSMLPSITDLVHKFNLDIDVALQVLIPYSFPHCHLQAGPYCACNAPCLCVGAPAFASGSEVVNTGQRISPLTWLF